MENKLKIELKLIDVIEYLKTNHSNLPSHIFDDLREIGKDIHELDGSIFEYKEPASNE